MSQDAFKVACSNCSLRELCMPVKLPEDQMTRLDDIVDNRRKIKRNEYIFKRGEPFKALYAVRTGVFKISTLTHDGREQVTGFQMSGEIMGMDGIVNDVHVCDAVALEDAEVCVMPFDHIEELAREVHELQHHMHKVMSREIVRENNVMMMLGSMRADERLAAFLLNLLERLQKRGFSSSELVLRMTRGEIANHLGIKIETVSRTFAKLVEEEVIEVDHRHILIKDMDALKRLAAPVVRH